MFIIISHVNVGVGMATFNTNLTYLDNYRNLYERI